MLLKKNKNFNEEDINKLNYASEELEKYHFKYINSIYNASENERKEVINSFKSDFKNIQRLFEEANCEIYVEGL